MPFPSSNHVSYFEVKTLNLKLMLESVLLALTCISFLLAAVTKYHKWSGLTEIYGLIGQVA